MEIKSASTFSSSLIKGLHKFKNNYSKVSDSYLIYSGKSYQLSDKTTVLNFAEISDVFS